MFRKVVAVALLISFLAMATSGMMMFVVNKTSFTLQMHPVHKLFGLVLIAAALSHLYLNIKPLIKHLRARSGVMTGSILTMLLVLLYGVAVNNAIPPESAEKLDSLAHAAEMMRETAN